MWTCGCELPCCAAIVRDLPPGITVDARAMSQASRSSAHWQRDFARGRADSADPHEWTGILLAWAYPDRIGRARGDGGRYLLANGRGARFGEAQALSKAEFIVAAELDGAEREARIFLAAPLTLADLEEHFSAQILDHAEIVWDDREQAIRARRERRLGALLLESAEMRNPDSQAMQNAALAGLRQLGIGGLPWTPELRQWQARVILMRQYAVPSPEPWPDLSDAALAATLEEWAPPWISGLTRREHFARMDLGNALRSRLSYAQGRHPRARGADAFHRAQRLAHTHRLSGRRYSDLVGAPAGDVRLEPDAERRRRPAAPAAEIAVAGEAPGANHAGSRELLESWIS